MSKKGKNNMNTEKKIDELLEASKNGMITTVQVTKAGLHRSVLQKLVNSGMLYQLGRRLYVKRMHGEMIFIFSNASIPAESILMIQPCIYGFILILLQQNI